MTPETQAKLQKVIDSTEKLASELIRQLENKQDRGEINGRAMMLLAHARTEFCFGDFKQAVKDAEFALSIAHE